MKQHKCSIAIGVVLAVGLGALLYDRTELIVWVGAAAVDIEFTITDESNGKPVNAATINVDTSEGGPENAIRLISNPDGTAHQQLPSCTTTGRQSPLKFTDTFAVRLPYWRYQVSAPGYQASEWIELHSPGRGLETIHVEPGHRRLIVPVTIRKEQLE